MKLKEKEKAIKLRKRGYSLKEISERLKVSKSAASLWLQNVALSQEAKQRLDSRYTLGQLNAQKTLRERGRRKAEEAELKARELMKCSPKDSRVHAAIVCAIIYWCEGNKAIDSVKFTNSDPYLISTFINLLERGFGIDRGRIKLLMHLHEYHDEETQLQFWSKMTKIPTSQFNRSYIKPNTGRSYKEGYPGCVCVYYGSNDLSRELLAIGRLFTKQYAVIE